MVDVPKTRRVLPSVSPSFETPRGGNAANFGVQVAQSLESVGVGLEKAQEDHRTTEAKRWRVEYLARQRELLYGTPDKPGYYNLNGKAVLDAAPAAKEGLAELKETILKQVADPVVRNEILGPTLDLEEENSLARMDQFAVSARQTDALAVEDAHVDSLIKRAVDEEGANLLAAEHGILASSATRADILGAKDEHLRDTLFREGRTQLYKEVVESLYSKGKVQLAKEIFEKADKAGKLDPAVATSVREGLDAADTLDKAQRQADDIFLKRLPRDEAMSQVTKIDDPKVRAKTATILENMYDDQEKARKEYENGVVRSARVAARNGTDPEVWMMQNPEHREALQGSGDLKSVEDDFILGREGKEHPLHSNQKVVDSLRQMTHEEIRELDRDIGIDSLNSQLSADDAKTFQQKLGAANESLDKASKNGSMRSSAEKELEKRMPPNFRWGKDDQKDANRKMQQFMVDEMNSRITDSLNRGVDPDVATTQRWAHDIATQVSITDDSWEWISDIFPNFASREEYLINVQNLTDSEIATMRVDIDQISRFDQTRIRGLLREFLKVGNEQITDEMVEEIALGYATQRPDIIDRAKERFRKQVRIPAPRRQPLPKVAPVPAPAPEPETEAVPAPSPTPVDNDPVAITEQISEHEGLRTTAYTDTVGVRTIGFGFNLQKPGARRRIEDLGYDYQAVRKGEQPISEADAATLRDQDIVIATRDAAAVVSNFSELGPSQQAALIDMAFNMGRTRLAGFKKMIAAIEAGDLEEAAKQAENSKWFNQVGRRGPAIVAKLRGA